MVRVGSTTAANDKDLTERQPSIDGGGMKSGGLTAGWTARIVRQVGNYGESFERNLGDGSSLKMERGRNKLWKDGGLIYAPPVE